MGMGSSMASSLATVAGGATDIDTANKQADEAKKLQSDAMHLPVESLRPEFWQKYLMDANQANTGMPGLDMYKNMLAQQAAAHFRAIQNSSSSGGEAVNAISKLLYTQNNAVGELGAKNAEYMGAKQNETGQDLWNIGVQQRALEMWRNQERDKMLAQVANLKAAATANRASGIKNIIGGSFSFIGGMGDMGMGGGGGGTGGSAGGMGGGAMAGALGGMGG